MAKEKIYNELESCTSGRESSSVTLVTDLKTGESEFIVEKSFREYYPATEHEKVMQLHKDLNRGGGRRAYSLEELTK